MYAGGAADGTKWSSPANIFENKIRLRFFANFLAFFTFSFFGISGWNSRSLVSQVIENPLTDGWEDRRVASEVCFCMLFLGGTLFWVVCVMIGGEAMKGGPAKHF